MEDEPREKNSQTCSIAPNFRFYGKRFLKDFLRFGWIPGAQGNPITHKIFLQILYVPGQLPHRFQADWLGRFRDLALQRWRNFQNPAPAPRPPAPFPQLFWGSARKLPHKRFFRFFIRCGTIAAPKMRDKIGEAPFIESSRDGPKTRARWFATGTARCAHETSTDHRFDQLRQKIDREGCKHPHN